MLILELDSSALGLNIRVTGATLMMHDGLDVVRIT